MKERIRGEQREGNEGVCVCVLLVTTQVTCADVHVTAVCIH